jgi:hypothetical protein
MHFLQSTLVFGLVLAPAAALAQVDPTPVNPAPPPVPPSETPPAPLSPAPVEPAYPPTPQPAYPAAPAPEQAMPLAAAPPVVPAAGDAPLSPLPIKYTASFFTRYEVREGYRDLGRSAGRFQEGDATVYRARFGLMTAPMKVGRNIEAVLQFTPQASGWLGETDTIVDYDLGLYEGYLRVQDGSEKVQFDIGRFRMDYGDALVIGDLGWHQTGRAFEGMRARWALGTAWIDSFFTQVDEGRPLSDAFGAGDRYFYGVYAGLGSLVAEGLALDFYGLGRSSPTTVGVVSSADPTRQTPTVKSATDVTLGARAKQKVGAFDYRVEAGLQFGSRPAAVTGTVPATGEPPELDPVTVLAYQVDAEAGVSGAGLRAAVGALVASGDDPSTDKNEGYDQLYPTAHKFLGLSDIFGARSNVFSINGNLSYKVIDAFTLMAQPHVLWTMQTPTIGVEDYTGTEIDMHAIYALGQGLTLRGMYGLFLSSSDGPYQDDGPAHYLEIELAFLLK